MTLEQSYLLQMIRGECLTDAITMQQWEEMIDVANRHAVLSTLYPQLKQYQKNMGEHTWEKVCEVSNQVVYTNYRLLFLTRFLVALLEENQIPVVVLKGAVTGSYYPQFELRKSGDIDLFVSKDTLQQAVQVLEKEGYVRNENSHSVHHEEFDTKEGIVIELHSMMIEPIEHKTINQRMIQIGEMGLEERKNISVMGVMLPTFSEAYHAYYLIMHMLHHYLRKGFGIKLLCDWVMFWKCEHTKDTKEQLLQMIEQTGLSTFVRTITAICVREMGLVETKVEFLRPSKAIEEDMELLLEELWEAEEFGESSKDRMVATKGASLRHLFEEFHHQMRLNYHKASKHVILWPLLWGMTLVGFHHNNRTLRKTSARSILKKAKERSRLRKRMQIFEI